jgi:hypothetical protein
MVLADLQQKALIKIAETTDTAAHAPSTGLHTFAANK